jgi:hypothetical protein
MHWPTGALPNESSGKDGRRFERFPQLRRPAHAASDQAIEAEKDDQLATLRKQHDVAR